MPNQVQSKDQIGFVQLESTFGVIPNASGTSSVAATNAFLVTSLVTPGDQAIIDRPDKTGTLSRVIGAGGKKTSKGGTMKCSLAGSGTPGTAPDIGPFLQASFGKAPTIAAGVSVTYALDDLTPSLSIFNFRTPSTASQSCSFGSVMDSMTVNVGADVADIEFGFDSYWNINTDIFSTSDTPGKGGLTTFPAEPASPVTNGTMAVGFLGVATLDGNVYTSLRSAKINARFNREIPDDQFGSYYGGLPGQSVRDISLDLDLYDDDSANLKSLKTKATNKTPMTLIIQVGVTAGNIWTFTFNNCMLTAPKYSDGQRRYSVSFTAKAAATSASAKDEMTLVIT